MRREWAITIVADSNHLEIHCAGQVRVGAAWAELPAPPCVDLICDPEEADTNLLKDALVSLIERL